MDNSTIDSVHSQARPVEKRMMRRHLILLPLPLFIHAIFPLFFFYTSTSGFYSPIPHPHLKHFPASLPLPGFIHLFHIPIFRFTSTSRFYSPVPHPHFSLHFHFRVLFIHFHFQFSRFYRFHFHFHFPGFIQTRYTQSWSFRRN